VAAEIRGMVSEPPPAAASAIVQSPDLDAAPPALALVRGQLRAYARSYERTRQRMRPSGERTHRMEQIFAAMRSLATAAYPLLDELAASPSPGERLAAVAVLQALSSTHHLPFLVRLVGSEKPFVGYHAARALRFAVGALDVHAHAMLLQALHALQTAAPGFDSDRHHELEAAEHELRATMAALAAPAAGYD
jgi:hypothetical protein